MGIKTIHAERGKPLCIGRQGENNARQVIFDVSHWRAVYGPGTVQLLVQRTGEATPYPAALTVEGSNAIWTITAADTAIPGQFGKAELRYLVNDTLAKSETWTTLVVDALGDPSETPPEAQKGWVDQVLQAGADVKINAAQAIKAIQDAGDTEIKGIADTGAAQLQAIQDAGAKGVQDIEDSYTGKVDAINAAGDTQVERVATEGTAQVAAATEQASAAASSAATAKKAYENALVAKNLAVQSEGDAAASATESAASAKASREAQNRAETAAIRQPYPNPETGTWWAWNVETGAYVDTHEPYNGNVMFAVFDLDPATGELHMITPDGYAGPQFAINENGELVVTING